MINNNIHIKVIESLRMRKKEVEKSFGLAGWVGFWLPVLLFGIHVAYYVSRLLVNDLALVANLFSPDTFLESKMYIEFNFPTMIACFVFVILGYFAFGARRRPALYLYTGSAAVFIVVSIIMIVLDYEKTTYVAAILYCAAMIFVCHDCIKAHKDDTLLSGIDGYPHFNATLMQEERTEEKSLIRFPDKKSYDELYDERMELYAKENPDSETAKAYNREREEKKDTELSGWLAGMMGKTEENQ